ncbi:hypothetical protein B7494_g6041 [Chlorociboria aeruginascens]|nr:hypothetical protein B7494_g6041 [Chlorociboria aeruginascens]
MSSQPTPQGNIRQDDHGRIREQRAEAETPTSSSDERRKGPKLLRDSPNWLSEVRTLEETKVIILLTPVVIPINPEPTDTGDPFEPLGRALAKRHARVRQVPYTQRNGITSTHLGFIKRGHIIIICFSLQPSQPFQHEFADVAFAVSNNKPCIVVVCCSSADSQLDIPFPTVIRTVGYSPSVLEATAALIFGENTLSLNTDVAVTFQPEIWPVELWNEARDMSSVLNLWTESMDGRFSIDKETLGYLLRRPGYAKHYVVRDSRNGELLGFCATYLSYVDQEGEKLLASLAVLMVRSTYRQRGIGLSLHKHAMEQFQGTRGVMRLQLGSTFPRILYGPPIDMQVDEEWFHRRGWRLDQNLPGQGQPIHDLILNFGAWKYQQIPLLDLHFRSCVQQDMVRVLDHVERASMEQGRIGWFDQYSSLMNGPNVKDIILCLENDAVVGVALTYTPSCGSAIASNLPWASLIGNDVGGVTCICISSPIRNTIMSGLLNASVKNLLNQGMKKMFFDGVADVEYENLRKLGFEEWARYHDVWKNT